MVVKCHFAMEVIELGIFMFSLESEPFVSISQLVVIPDSEMGRL